MSVFTYENTLVPSGSVLSTLSPARRKALVKGLFSVTEVGLLAGLFLHPIYWQWVVWFSVLNALLFVGLAGFKPLAFPAQLRIIYVLWVAVGTFAPWMTWMMYVTTAGIATNLIFGWCPLARMISLLPWNREERFSLGLVLRTFFSAPRSGRFRAKGRIQESS